MTHFINPDERLTISKIRDLFEEMLCSPEAPSREVDFIHINMS